MRRYITLVAVGDNNSRKTDLLLRFTRSSENAQQVFPLYRFEETIRDVTIDNKHCSLHLMDTECDDDYKLLRWEAYDKADGVLLCYSIKDRNSFLNLSKWCLEIRKRQPNLPIVVIATGSETRNTKEEEVSQEEGQDFKILIAACAYLECYVDVYTSVEAALFQAIRSICQKSKSTLDIAYVNDRRKVVHQCTYNLQIQNAYSPPNMKLH